MLRSYCRETARRYIRLSFSVHAVGKTMRWIRKWMTFFGMGTTSSITMQSLGKIVQRAPLYVRKCGIFCLFVCHAPRPQHCASEGCVVRTSIALPFIVGFQRGMQLFQKGLLFNVHYIVLISFARWCHSIREIAVKNCENLKNRRKSCAHHFV